MRRPRRTNRSGRNTIRENFTFSISPGSSSNILVATLGNRPPRSNFRPLSFTVSAATAYVPPTSTLPGYYVPAALQLLLLTPSGEFCSTSGQQSLGSNPRRLTVRYPRSADWYPYNNVGTDVVAVIDCVCLGTTPSTAVVRGTAQIRLSVSQEVVVPTCPTVHLMNSGPSPSHINQNDNPSNVLALPSTSQPLALDASLVEVSSDESSYEDSVSDFSLL